MFDNGETARVRGVRGGGVRGRGVRGSDVLESGVCGYCVSDCGICRCDICECGDICGSGLRGCDPVCSGWDGFDVTIDVINAVCDGVWLSAVVCTGLCMLDVGLNTEFSGAGGPLDESFTFS